MRIVILVTGIIIMLAVFWFLSIKRLTVDFAAAWGIFGAFMLLTGIVTPLYIWVARFLLETGTAVMSMGVVCLLMGFLFSFSMSRLMMKNQELAIEVSLLKQEKKKELLVVIPAYNEEENIQKVLTQLEQQYIMEIADILVVDDASTDNTGQVARAHQCTVITNVFWLGYGNALQLGYRYAARQRYQYVIQMDADGQHDVCNIPVIYQRLREKNDIGRYPDIILGSRFMRGSSPFPVIALKKFAYMLFRIIIRGITGRWILDPTTGLQGLSRKAFLYYAEPGHFDDRYPDANMVLQMLLLGFEVVQIPAVMHARTEGKSMHGGIKDAWYMCRMSFEIPAIVFRIKVLRRDAEVGNAGCAQEEDKDL